MRRASWLAPARAVLARRSLAGSSGQLALANLLFVALSTAQVLFVGAVFGTRHTYEVFVLAWMVPEWCLYGLGNVMQMYVTPVVLKVRAQEGGAEEQAAIWSLVMSVVASVGIAAAAAAILAPWVLRIAAPGLSAADMPQAVWMFRVLLVAACAQGSVKLLSSLHRVAHSLTISSLAQSATPLVVMGLLVFVPGLGVGALAFGFVGGALINLALLAPGPVAWGMLRPRWPLRGALIVDLLRSAVPLALATTGFRLVVLLDRAVASGLDQGDVTVLRYALFFLVSVQGVVVMPFLNVAYNRLAMLYSEGRDGAVGVVLLFLQLLWLLVVPATLILVLYAEPIVAIALGRGVFDAQAVARTAQVLERLALTLPFMVGYMISLQALLARRRYAYATALAVAIPAVSLAAKLPVAHGWGVRGLALATAVTMAAWFAALLLRLLPEAGRADRVLVARRGGLLCVVVAVSVGVAILIRPALPLAPIPRLLVGGGSLGAAYALTLLLLARRHVVALWRELARTRVGT